MSGRLILQLREDRRVREHTQAAIIAWVFASRTSAVEMDLADTTDVVVGDIPSPCRHRVPLLDLDLHVEFQEYVRLQRVSRWLMKLFASL